MVNTGGSKGDTGYQRCVRPSDQLSATAFVGGDPCESKVTLAAMTAGASHDPHHLVDSGGIRGWTSSSRGASGSRSPELPRDDRSRHRRLADRRGDRQTL